MLSGGCGAFRSALLLSSSITRASIGGVNRALQQHGWSSAWLGAALPAAVSALPSAIITTPFITVRSKHSNSVVKRQFKYHQGRIRRNRALGIAPRYEILPERQFPKVHSFDYFPNTWTGEPLAAAERPNYPFHVARTRNKPRDATGFLPVYTKYRNDNTKVITRIKKVTGDREAFIRELRAVVGLPKPLNPNNEKIKIKTGGTIEVHRNVSGKVKRWLAGLGF